MDGRFLSRHEVAEDFLLVDIDQSGRGEGEFVWSLQILVKGWNAQSLPPLLALEDQNQDWQRDGKVDKSKDNPCVLEANLFAQVHRVEAYAETENLTAEVQ